MDLGFETIGNAVLICHDGGPLLVTDPWIEGDAYFGSWTFSHEIPDEQLAAIRACPYVWVSHGHPDHMSWQSLQLFRDKKILLADHIGGRIAKALRDDGFDVEVLPDRTWRALSSRVRVLTIADYNQDSILLVDLGGRLVANLNDANDRGWGGFVKRTVQAFPESFLLKLTCYGDADMINVFDENGAFIPPRAARKEPLGPGISAVMRDYGVRYFVPFSSMHRYQRADSIWANAFGTGLEDYPIDFDRAAGELLPAFIRYDALRDSVEQIAPAERPPRSVDPREFGDDWSAPLEPADKERLDRYFRSFRHLERVLDFLCFRVGGSEHVVTLTNARFGRGLTFDAPRHSLMAAVKWEIFDDMLIGNFMRTTLHGRFPETGLYPDFTPYVAKYGDNGLAHSEAELDAYFAAYRRRAPLDFLRHRVEERSIEVVRTLLPMDSGPYRLIRRVYHAAKGR
jgi:L-ascorbate metabolism protein UlaG (beta-lactamase superfamily)